jgi:hypothetical protein
MTPDPYQASASTSNPQSWNRYAYVNGDPINGNDPTGLYLPLPSGGGGYDWDYGGSGASNGFLEGSGGSGASGTGLDPGLIVTWGVFLQILPGAGSSVGGPSKPPSPVCGVTLGTTWDYVCLQNSGPGAYAAVETAVNSVSSALGNDPTCEKWLANTIGMKSLQLDIPYFYDMFAVASSFIDAKTGAAANDIDASSFDVPGYLAIINYTTFSTSSASYNRDTILHELAHMLKVKGFNQDDNSTGAQNANEALLQKNCSKTINGN